MSFSRSGLTSPLRSTRVPDLTPDQIGALSLVQSLAEDTKLQIALKRGDVLFFNNRKLLHGRARFENNNIDQSTGRHYLRLWLQDTTLAGRVPRELSQKWNDSFNYTEAMLKDPERWPMTPHVAYINANVS